MAEKEKVVIKIDVDADTKNIEKVTQALKRMKREEGRFESGSRRGLGAVSQSAVRLRRHVDFLDKGFRMLGKGLQMFLSLSIKGVVVEMALLSATMLATHALFASGKFLMKAYSGAMQLMAGAAATAAVALATAAAAVREYQAAMYAYRGRGAEEFGSGLNQARVGMRALSSDASLAMLGAEALNKAYAQMSKAMSTPQIAASTSMFKSLMDFGSAGQDPAAAAEKVGAMISALSDSKKSLSDVKNSAKEIGPEMEEALKKANVKTKEQLKQLIMSGELAKMGGVSGQYDAVTGTLFGRFKIFFNELRNQFADFGLSFLAPATESLQKIFKIISKDVERVMVEIGAFGEQKFFDGLVNTVERLSNWTRDLVIKWLPKASGMWQRISGWWGRFTDGWKKMVDAMRPLVDGSRVLLEVWEPIWDAIKRGGVDNLRVMREELLKNRDTVVEFGQRIAKLIDALSVHFQKMKQVIMQILPFINDLIGGLTQAFTAFSSMLTLGAGGGGFAGAMFPLMMFGLGGGRMKKAGGFMPNAMVGPGGTVTPAPQSPASRGFIPSGQGFASGGGGVPAGMTGAKPGRWRFGGMSRGAVGQMGAYQSWDPNLYASRNVLSYVNGAEELTSERMGRIGTARQYARYMRSNSRLGAGLFGNEALGKAGINNSMTAKMGVGLGMQTLSQYAPEEMQGMLALGGTLGMFNPMLGLGVGLGGAAMKAQGGGTGFLAGAAGGAALGTMMLPGIGTAVGAGIGAMAGAIMGSANKARAEINAAKDAVTSSVDALSTSYMSSAFTVISRNRAIIEAGGSTSGMQAGLGAGGLGMKNNLSGVQGRLAKAKEQGAYNSTNFKRNVLGMAGAGFAIGATGGAVAGLATGGVLSIPAALAAGTALAVQGAVAGAVVSAGDWLVGKITGNDRKVKAYTQVLQELYTYQEDYGLKISKDEYEAMTKSGSAMEESVKKYDEQIKATIGASDVLDSVYNERMAMLQNMTGKSAAEIEVLAQQLGVNLYDGTKKFMDIAQQLGAGMAKTSQEMKAAYRTAFLSSGNIFDEEIKAIQAQYAIDDASRNFFDKVRAGTATTEDELKFFGDLPGLIMNFAGGDAAKAFEMLGMFGPGGSMYAKGQAGQGGAALGEKYGGRMYDATKRELANVSATQIIDLLAEKDQTVNRQKLVSALGSLSEEDLVQTVKNLQGGMTIDQFASKDDSGIQAFLGAMGAFGLETEAFDTKNLDKLTDSLDTLAEELGVPVTVFKDAVDNFVEKAEQIFNKQGAAPTWWNTAPGWWTGKDTSSPRGNGIGDTVSSKLSQTMSRHEAMNGQLTGKRTITSAYRNFALGSPSSDHVMGRAYDLVGQNLGGYSKLVHANGGFAEFHGVGGARHLHVVPGPGPYGDTAAPNSMPMAVVSSPSGGSGVTNNINIYAAPGQSEEAIARMVIKRIAEHERNIRERS